MVAGLWRVIADGGGSMETVGAVGSFERWQLGSDDSLGAELVSLQWCSWCTMLRFHT